MSQIRVDSVEGDSNSAVVVSFGATVPNGTFCTVGAGLNLSGVLTATSHRGDNVNANGIVTASFYYGDGSNLTNLPVINSSKAIAYSIIL